MANIKISAMTSLSSVTDSTTLPVVDSGTNYKITASQIKTYMNLGNIATINKDGNSSNVLYGNGSFAAAPSGGGGSYANSNVSTLLSSFGSNSISTTGNVTANVATLTTIANIAVGNVKITGGSSGQVLTTDGAGNLSFTTVSGGSSPAGYGSVGYNKVWALSAKADSFWTTYTLTGNVEGLFGFSDLSGSNALSSQTVYGQQVSSGDKVLIVNDGPIHTNSTYGIVIEFPASPSVGDTFTTPAVNANVSNVNAGSFITGKEYTIVNVGTTTNWNSIGAGGGYIGQVFTATGPGSGDGVASYNNGINKIFFKPASGQRAIPVQAGGQNPSNPFGQGTNGIAGYLDINGQLGDQPVTWVYAGIINSIPTWYQTYV